MIFSVFYNLKLHHRILEIAKYKKMFSLKNLKWFKFNKLSTKSMCIVRTRNN